MGVRIEDKKRLGFIAMVKTDKERASLLEVLFFCIFLGGVYELSSMLGIRGGEG